MKKSKDNFGDRMKMYESQTTQRTLIPRLPVVARINPDLMIERNVVEILELPPLSKVSNKVDVIIYGKDVELYK